MNDRNVQEQHEIQKALVRPPNIVLINISLEVGVGRYVRLVTWITEENGSVVDFCVQDSSGRVHGLICEVKWERQIILFCFLLNVSLY